MANAPSYLRNADLVVEKFGYWPRFHDSPVVEFKYDPQGEGKVDLSLICWKGTSEVDDKGYFKRTKEHQIRFLFKGIVAANLEQFSPDNILFELGFPDAEMSVTGSFKVELDSAMGGELCGDFRAQQGEVVEVVPCGSEDA